MTQTTAPPATGMTRTRRDALPDRVFWALCAGAGLLVLLVLALILITTTRQAWPAFVHEGLDFVATDSWAPNRDVFGALAFVYGTLISSALGLLFAVPVSIGIALFLTELAPRRLRGPVITVIDLLAAIPSVVFGLWGILVVAPAVVHVYRWIHDSVGGVPVLGTVFGEPVSTGRGFMTAGLILAIMITPIITSISREVFSTVPTTEKHAALALGATRWEMIRGVVFPHSFGGLIGAVMLGLGRAMGETIALALVFGASTQIVANLFASGNAMPAVIVQQWGEAGGMHRNALVGLGVVLFVMTVIVNYLARVIVRRAESRMRGAAA